MAALSCSLEPMSWSDHQAGPRAAGHLGKVSGSGDLLISRVPRVKLKLCDYQEQCFRFQLTVCPSCVGSCSQSSPLSAHNIQGAEEQKCILLYELYVASSQPKLICYCWHSEQWKCRIFTPEPRSSGEWYSVSAPHSAVRSLEVCCNVLYFLNVRIFA